MASIRKISLELSHCILRRKEITSKVAYPPAESSEDHKVDVEFLQSEIVASDKLQYDGPFVNYEWQQKLYKLESPKCGYIGWVSCIVWASVVKPYAPTINRSYGDDNK